MTLKRIILAAALASALIGGSAAGALAHPLHFGHGPVILHPIHPGSWPLPFPQPHHHHHHWPFGGYPVGYGYGNGWDWQFHHHHHHHPGLGFYPVPL